MNNPSQLLGALRQTVRESEGDGGAPRRSNNLETTIQAATEAVRSGTVEPGLQAVAMQRERLALARHDLETHAQTVPPDTTAGAIIQRIRDLYAANGQSLDALEAAIKNLDGDAVDRAATVLADNTADMFDCHDAWKGEMTIMEAEAGGTVAVSEAYARLYQASDQLVLGQISANDWLKVLEPMERDVLQMQQKLDDGVATLRLKLAGEALAASIAAELQMALQEAVKGLQRMREYLASKDVAALNEGWSRLVAGNVRLQKATHTLTASQGVGGSTSDVVILEDE